MGLAGLTVARSDGWQRAVCGEEDYWATLYCVHGRVYNFLNLAELAVTRPFGNRGETGRIIGLYRK